MKYETSPTGHTVKDMRAEQTRINTEKREVVSSSFYPDGGKHHQVKVREEKPQAVVPAEFFKNNLRVDKHEFIQGVI